MNRGTLIRHRHNGFNIVELMVAIAIGGLLLTGAVSLFVSNRAASQLTQDLSRIQESGRFALDTIVADLRMAGYFGCANDMSRLNVDSDLTTTVGVLWNPATPIEGIDDYASGEGWKPSGYALGALNDANVIVGTDAITIRYLGARLPDHKVLAQSGSTVTINSATNMADGVVMGIADCGSVDVRRLCHVSICGGTAGIDSSGTDPILTLNGGLSRSFEPSVNPVAAPLVGRRYFIARNDSNKHSLFRASIAVDSDEPGAPLLEQVTELFEGVSDMQILYGLDDNGDDVADNFVKAGDANLDADTDSWANVVALKIGIMVVSTTGRGEAVSQDLGNLLDKNMGTVTDNFRRRFFQTTVQIRNL